MSLFTCPKCKQRVRVITRRITYKKHKAWGYYCIECGALVKLEDED